jgi:AraC-like DNA-binding protein
MKVESFALPPPHPLRPYVHSIWKISNAVPGHRERILPRGVVDLLFPLAGQVRLEDRGPRTPPILTDAPFVVGVQNRAVTTVTAGLTTLLGVSLRAEMARAILPLPAREISGAVVEAPLVLGDAGRIFARLGAATSFGDQCGILLRWLLDRLKPDRRIDAVGQVCGMLARTPTEARIRDAAKSLLVSPRHVRRLLLDHIGMAPQDYIRLRRFSRVLALMASTQNLTTIAQEAHYYDQAHLCHDFQTIAGMTPREYRAQSGPVPGLVFSEDVRLIQAPDDAGT